MQYTTQQRNVLLQFLQKNHDKMFTAKQISDALKDKNISRSAVYRNLAELEEEQKIKRSVKTGSREAFYQYCDLQICKTHIHLSCTNCGKIFHMENQIAEALVCKLENAEGFEINKEKTTLYGLCRDCQG